jgi:hypothetical protein
MNLNIGMFRNRMIVWMLLACVIISLSLSYLFLPAYNNVIQLAEQINQLEQQRLSGEETLQQTIITNKYAAEINAALLQVHQAFVSSNNPLDFINQLEIIAQDHQVQLNVNVDNQSTATTKSAGNESVVALNIAVTGTLTNSLMFVHALLNNPTYINITNLKITPSNDTSGYASSDHVTIDITALTYWQ